MWIMYFPLNICKTLKCDGTPKCDGHAKVQWFARKCNGIMRESTMVYAKVRWYDALKCDGHGWRKSVMARRAKVQWSHVTRKCDGMLHLNAMVHAKVWWCDAIKCDSHSDAKVRWYAALKCDGLRFSPMLWRAKVRWSQVKGMCYVTPC